MSGPLAGSSPAPHASVLGRNGGGYKLAMSFYKRFAMRAGVAALYVHIMAVNTAAARFYQLQGFTCEQEESSNQAHYR